MRVATRGGVARQLANAAQRAIVQESDLSFDRYQTARPGATFSSNSGSSGQRRRVVATIGCARLSRSPGRARDRQGAPGADAWSTFTSSASTRATFTGRAARPQPSKVRARASALSAAGAARRCANAADVRLAGGWRAPARCERVGNDLRCAQLDSGRWTAVVAIQQVRARVAASVAHCTRHVRLHAYRLVLGARATRRSRAKASYASGAARGGARRGSASARGDRRAGRAGASARRCAPPPPGGRVVVVVVVVRVLDVKVARRGTAANHRRRVDSSRRRGSRADHLLRHRGLAVPRETGPDALRGRRP